jgi:hypothetical protein
MWRSRLGTVLAAKEIEIARKQIGYFVEDSKLGDARTLFRGHSQCDFDTVRFNRQAERALLHPIDQFGRLVNQATSYVPIDQFLDIGQMHQN